MPALKDYRGFLDGTLTDANTETRLNVAIRHYLDQAAKFSTEELAVLNQLKLTDLHSSSFWAVLASTERTIAQRQRLLVSAYSRLMFATGQLPGLLGLVREASAVESLQVPDTQTGVLALRVHDAGEPASDPERLARLIDGIDMIYESCAVLAGKPGRGLKLMSLSGLAFRTLVFHGHTEPLTASRRIIHSLNERVDHTSVQDVSVLERICTELPFMASLDELNRVGSISARKVEQVRKGVIGGSIMLVEAGAMLTDYQVGREQAKIDIEAGGFDAIDRQAESGAEQVWEHEYERAKNKLIGKSEADFQGSAVTRIADAGGLPSIADDGGDALDALVAELRSRYKGK